MSSQEKPLEGKQSDSDTTSGSYLELLQQYQAINDAGVSIPVPAVSDAEWQSTWSKIRAGMQTAEDHDSTNDSAYWESVDRTARDGEVPPVSTQEWDELWSRVTAALRQPALPDDVTPEMVSAYLDGELPTEIAERVDAVLNTQESAALDSWARDERVPDVEMAEWNVRWDSISKAIEPAVERAVDGMDAKLSAYHDGELDADGVTEVDAWLKDHPEGQETLDRFARLDEIARSDEVPPVRQSDWPETNIVSVEETVTARPTWGSFGYWIATAAAGLLAILWATDSFQPPPEQPLAWKTQNESSAVEVDASNGDAYVYYSSEADLTIIWQTPD